MKATFTRILVSALTLVTVAVSSAQTNEIDSAASARPNWTLYYLMQTPDPREGEPVISVMRR